MKYPDLMLARVIGFWIFILVIIISIVTVFINVSESKHKCTWCYDIIWEEGTQIREYWLHDLCWSVLAGEVKGEEVYLKVNSDLIEDICMMLKERKHN